MFKKLCAGQLLRDVLQKNSSIEGSCLDRQDHGSTDEDVVAREFGEGKVSTTAVVISKSSSSMPSASLKRRMRISNERMTPENAAENTHRVCVLHFSAFPVFSSWGCTTSTHN